MSASVFGDQTKAFESRVLDKQKCDRIKVLVKKLFNNIDEQKTGQVKTEVFNQICSLHNIRLDPQASAKLAAECRPKQSNLTDTIMYKDALQRITINMDVDEPLMKEWIVRQPNLANG